MFAFAKCLHFPKMLPLETHGIFHVKWSTVGWVGMVVVLVWKPGKTVNSVQFEPTFFFNCLTWQLNWKTSYLTALSPPLQLDPCVLLGNCSTGPWSCSCMAQRHEMEIKFRVVWIFWNWGNSEVRLNGGNPQYLHYWTFQGHTCFHRFPLSLACQKDTFDPYGKY